MTVLVPLLIAMIGLFALLAQTETALAAENGLIEYHDENGFIALLHEGEYTELKSGSTVGLNPGWYVVKENVTITGNLVINCDSNIVILDGAKLTVRKGIVLYNKLGIYGCSSDPAKSGVLDAAATPNGAAIGNMKKSARRAELDINGGHVIARGGNSTVPSIGGPGLNVRINGGTVDVYGRFGVGSPDANYPLKLFLKWWDKDHDSIRISSYRNVNATMVNDFRYWAEDNPQYHRTVVTPPLVDGLQMVPILHNWSPIQYKIIAKEGSNTPEKVEARRFCSHCGTEEVEVAGLTSGKNADGSIEYVAVFQNPDFGQYSFTDDGQRGDAAVMNTTPMQKTVKASALKKNSAKFNLKTTVVNDKITSIKYTKKSGSKKITVSKSGKVTVKKGLKKGTYNVKVKIAVTLKNANNKASEVKTIKVIVR
jgi:hypothetical protein